MLARGIQRDSAASHLIVEWRAELLTEGLRVFGGTLFGMFLRDMEQEPWSRKSEMCSVLLLVSLGLTLHKVASCVSTDQPRTFLDMRTETPSFALSVLGREFHRLAWREQQRLRASS